MAKIKLSNVRNLILLLRFNYESNYIFFFHFKEVGLIIVKNAF